MSILIDNAIKNSDDKTTIFVKCIRDGDRRLIEVKNTGKGIAAADMDYIFDRFYTTEQSRSNGSFGLGLAIAKAIVDRHGGEISAESMPIKGLDKKETTFSVSI